MTNELMLMSQQQIYNASVEDLKRELARGLEITAERLKYVATIWQELHRRGEDLSDLRSGLMEYIPLIATQQVDPNLVIACAGHKTLLSALSRLPISKQNEIAKNGGVSIAHLDENGEKVIVEKTLANLRVEDIYYAFGDGYVRNASEQIKLRLKHSVKPKAQKKPRKTSNIRFNDDGATMRIGTNTVSIEQLIETLSERFNIEIKPEAPEA